MEKKSKNKTIRSLILLACAAVVGVSVYADWNYNQNRDVDTGGYLYNSEITGEQVKLLGEATYVGQTVNEADVSQEVANTGAEESYFTVASLERQKSRDESLTLLQTVVDSSESMPDAKSKALDDIAAIASAIEAENNIETLIKAKGFDDCVAVVSGTEANVIVKTTGLLTYEVAQIREIVMNELSIPAENVKIIERTD